MCWLVQTQGAEGPVYVSVNDSTSKIWYRATDFNIKVLLNQEPIEWRVNGMLWDRIRAAAVWITRFCGSRCGHSLMNPLKYDRSSFPQYWTEPDHNGTGLWTRVFLTKGDVLPLSMVEILTSFYLLTDVMYLCGGWVEMKGKSCSYIFSHPDTILFCFQWCRSLDFAHNRWQHH